jgi:hypothetical protein
MLNAKAPGRRPTGDLIICVKGDEVHGGTTGRFEAEPGGSVAGYYTATVISLLGTLLGKPAGTAPLGSCPQN